MLSFHLIVFYPKNKKPSTKVDGFILFLFENFYVVGGKAPSLVNEISLLNNGATV